MRNTIRSMRLTLDIRQTDLGHAFRLLNEQVFVELLYVHARMQYNKQLLEAILF
jgi:hypothetical protein